MPLVVGTYISGVTVLPGWRRHGAGDRLLEELLTWIWRRHASACPGVLLRSERR